MTGVLKIADGIFTIEEQDLSLLQIAARAIADSQNKKASNLQLSREARAAAVEKALIAARLSRFIAEQLTTARDTVEHKE